MNRFLAVAAAAAATLALSPAAGFAQAPAQGGYYAATAAIAPTKTKMITRATVWNCADTVCIARKADARDGIVCELVAKEVGKLTAFRANGAEFDTAALEKCNAKAR